MSFQIGDQVKYIGYIQGNTGINNEDTYKIREESIEDGKTWYRISNITDAKHALASWWFKEEVLRLVSLVSVKESKPIISTLKVTKNKLII